MTLKKHLIIDYDKTVKPLTGYIKKKNRLISEYLKSKNRLIIFNIFFLLTKTSILIYANMQFSIIKKEYWIRLNNIKNRCDIFILYDHK